ARSSFDSKKEFTKARDDNGQVVALTKGKKSPLADPDRYQSQKMAQLTLEHHGLTSRGQLANPMKRGRSPLMNPVRYYSPALKRARIEQHSGRK
ncbi:unnamed protein product, partial [Aphanomyces euteiches]